MTKPKTDKQIPVKPSTETKRKRSGKIIELDELELTKVVGGGYADPANNCVLE